MSRDHSVGPKDVTKVLVDVNIFSDVSEESEVVVVLSRAVNDSDFMITDGDGCRRITKRDAAIGNGKRDRWQLLNVCCRRHVLNLKVNELSPETIAARTENEIFRDFPHFPFPSFLSVSGSLHRWRLAYHHRGDSSIGRRIHTKD